MREEWWKEYHANQLRKLKELDQEESKKEKDLNWKQLCEEQLEENRQKELMTGSEGQLLTHPDEAPAALAGDLQTLLEVSTLSEGVCGDDPSTLEEIMEEIKEHGSEGHFPLHPDEVPITLACDLKTVEVSLSERVGEDDPSVSREWSSESESSSESSSESTASSSSEVEECEEEKVEEELPPLIRIEDNEGKPPLGRLEESSSGISPTTWEEIEPRRPPRPRLGEESSWQSVEQGIAQRHRERHQAFGARRRQVNQGIYVESRDVSPISPWAGLPEKGT
jgi:hypothetical protein